MRNAQMRELMNGAWILSLGGLITKILSAVYRIPFQNLVGDTGFYIYQQVYPIYGLGMVLALSGLPVYVSKLVAAAGSSEAQRRVARRCISLLAALGGLAFVLIFAGARPLALAMADVQLTPLIRCVAFMFLLLPILGGARGYFQGVGNMVPTASSQVLEQLVRVAIIIAAAVCGRYFHWSLYLTGTVAMSGALFGGTAAAVLIFPRLQVALAGRLLPRRAQLPTRDFVRHFLIDGGAFVLFSALLILLQLVDSFTVTRGLALHGLAPAVARAAKGVYDRGQPLVQLGLVVATALTQSLLPSLSRSNHYGQKTAFTRISVMLLHLTVVFGVLASLALAVVMPNLNRFLFGDAQGSGVLAMYVLSVALVAAVNALSSLLQSQDQFRTPTVALVLALLTKITFNLPLTARWGTFGSALASNLAWLVALATVYAAIPGAIRHNFWHNGFGRRLALTALALCVSGALLGQLLPPSGRLAGLVHCLLIGLGAGAVTLLVAYQQQLLALREILVIPAGRKIMKLLSQFKRG
ncbi:putative polysaccharide biosynthesis protein [Lacticaseibacillus zhaodongensis]|uniref:putative polysaccharide biosynthesis protein n=1 Tax=Lacticaseibacillus zhaodongensis TaxID=2668065 RepID=UPI0018AF98FA|nr:polysaccharide biosynthesis protein [Lacticaseibacillus zhaodongensis]